MICLDNTTCIDDSFIIDETATADERRSMQYNTCIDVGWLLHILVYCRTRMMDNAYYCRATLRFQTQSSFMPSRSCSCC